MKRSGNRASAQIQLRVTRDRKAAYRRWSERLQKPLTKAIFAVLDREAGYKERAA